ncbi:MAG: transcriptional regulator [Planctomycetes bacterium]|nr:transcriptional regulator [Planctomycetota bacterium]
MKLEEVRRTLDAEWSGRRASRADSMGTEVLSCHASDLMSDVLTSRGAGSLLLTGLTNAQVVRVAVVSDFAAVCFVRGKKPQSEAVQVAEESQIPLLVTPMSMYESCGRLYTKGLPVGDRAKEAPSCQKK